MLRVGSRGGGRAIPDLEKEQRLAECAADYHQRRALRQSARPEDYRERLDEHFDDFLELLAAEESLDRKPTLSSVAPLPRPFGEYTLLAELGRGAMGVVFEAVHRSLGRRVALKILRTGFDVEETARERFRREARACAAVRHENVVEIYEAGEVEEQPFYAMERLEGRTLADLIHAEAVPGPEDFCRALADVADALETMHAAGIVHRDVKPGNLLVTPEGRVVLCDFGLARTAMSETLTQTGQAMGTPLYMSPEQVYPEQGEVDERSDVYGLGACLYEALAGRPPFQADGFPELMRMILRDRPAPLPDSVPAPCRDVAMKAIERRPEDRYPSAAALRDDLRAFAEGRPVTGRPVSRARRLLRRSRTPALATLAVLLIAAATLFWLSRRPGTLEVTCFPAARVHVDGVDHGQTPVSIELPPGRHEVVLVLEGFEEGRQQVTIRPGATRTLQTAILAKDGDDPRALARLSEELELARAGLERWRRDRSGSGPARPTDVVAPLFPRGELRGSDLGAYRIDLLDTNYPAGSRLVFRRGDEVLWEASYAPEMVVTEEPFPDAVRAALRPGDRVTWGYEAADGKAVKATFRLLDEAEERDAAEALARLETRLEDQPEILVRLLRTRLLLRLGLAQAALEEARTIVTEREEDARGWALVLASLRRLGLGESKLARATEARIDEFPDGVRESLLAPR